jgi:arylsulfatase A-like enzyme
VAYITNPNVGKPFGFDRGYAQFMGNGGGIPPASKVRNEVAKLLPQLQSRFYLYLHLIDPHDPYTPQRAWDNDPPSPEEYVQPQEIRKSGKPPSAEQLARMRNQYDGEIHEMDRAIEGMFDDLESLGLLNDTLVVFTSDHGEEFYEHQDLTHGSTLYDEVLLVPFLLGNLKPPMQRRSSTEIFHQVDFLPTVLEALGLPVPAEVDGVSQWPAIANGEPLDVWDLFSHLDLDKKQFFAIQAGRHKLILSGSDSRAQFFDLSLDPQERTPLPPTSPEAAALVRRLRSVDRSLAAKSYQSREAKTDADTLATLKALGYIQ